MSVRPAYRIQQLWSHRRSNAAVHTCNTDYWPARGHLLVSWIRQISTVYSHYTLVSIITLATELVRMYTRDEGAALRLNRAMHAPPSILAKVLYLPSS